jgi:hypothetical protein
VTLFLTQTGETQRGLTTTTLYERTSKMSAIMKRWKEAKGRDAGILNSDVQTEEDAR